MDLIIKSHILWNVDNLTKIPKNYFSGNNKEIIQNYTLLGKDLKLKIFFPEQKFGRELNSTTTVIQYIYIDGIKVFESNYFGQHSDNFDSYDTAILYILNHNFINDGFISSKIVSGV